VELSVECVPVDADQRVDDCIEIGLFFDVLVVDFGGGIAAARLLRTLWPNP
jgi:hypothetical protein